MASVPVVMSVTDIVTKTANIEQCIAYLRDLGLIRKLESCCGKPMKDHRCSTSDKHRWICFHCKKTKCIRDGSLFKVWSLFFFNIHQYIIYLIQKLQIFGFFVISLSVWYNKTTTCHYSGPCIMRPPLLQIPSGLSGGCGLISGYGEGWCGLCESRSQLYIYILLLI